MNKKISINTFMKYLNGINIWGMFLVLNNLYSNTDHSKKVKTITQKFLIKSY